MTMHDPRPTLIDTVNEDLAPILAKHGIRHVLESLGDTLEYNAREFLRRAPGAMGEAVADERLEAARHVRQAAEWIDI